MALPPFFLMSFKVCLLLHYWKVQIPLICSFTLHVALFRFKFWFDYANFYFLYSLFLTWSNMAYVFLGCEIYVWPLFLFASLGSIFQFPLPLLFFVSEFSLGISGSPFSVWFYFEFAVVGCLSMEVNKRGAGSSFQLGRPCFFSLLSAFSFHRSSRLWSGRWVHSVSGYNCSIHLPCFLFRFALLQYLPPISNL